MYVGFGVNIVNALAQYSIMGLKTIFNMVFSRKENSQYYPLIF